MPFNSDQSFVNSFHSHLNSDRKKQRYTDFVLKRRDLAIPCHRIVLRARSRVFDNNILDVSEYEFKSDAPDEIIEAVVDFIYTLQINISSANVFPLVKIAHELHLEDLTALCDEFFMHKALDAQQVEECFNLFIWADTFGLNQSKKKALALFYDEFESIADRPQFLELQLERFQAIIGSDKLKVINERKVFDLAMTWIQAKEDRISLAGDVMGLARLALVDIHFEEYLKLKQSDIFSSGEAGTLLDTAMRYRASPASRWELCSLLAMPRLSHATQMVLVVGAKLPNQISFVYLNPENCQWIALKSFVPDTRSCGVASLLACIYDTNLVVLDGYRNEFCSCEIISSSTSQSNHKPTNSLTALERFRRTVDFDTSGMAIVAVPGSVLCVGPVCKKLNLSSGVWQEMPMLKVAVRNPCVFHANNMVYVFGGFVSQNSHLVYHNKIQILSLDDEEWTMLDTPIPVDDIVLSAACYDNNVYLLMSGGTVQIFDPVGCLFKHAANLGVAELSSGSIVVYLHSLLVLCWDQKECSCILVDLVAHTTTELGSLLSLYGHSCGTPSSRVGSFSSMFASANATQPCQSTGEIGENVVQCFTLLLPRLH